MVRPCKECENEYKRCKGCNDWQEWFAEAFDRTSEVVRNLTTYYDTHERPHAEPRPTTYREIVFWTVFTEQWR